jgi:hypothetical protein
MNSKPRGVSTSAPSKNQTSDQPSELSCRHFEFYESVSKTHSRCIFACLQLVVQENENDQDHHVAVVVQCFCSGVLDSLPRGWCVVSTASAETKPSCSAKSKCVCSIRLACAPILVS